MKAPPFRYHRAADLADLLGVLGDHGDAAEILAGGQSLMPVLAFRLSAPALLVDINRVPGLGAIAATAGTVRIGALARLAEIAAGAAIAAGLPLIAQAVGHVGHPAVRNRGTFGGSIALADPAAELPACAVALDAEIVLQSAARGRRTVPAERFYRGLFATERQADEVVVEVRIAEARAQDRHGFVEFARRHGDFALAGVACRLRLGADGATIADLRLVPFGATPYPRVSAAAARAARGQTLGPATADAVAAAVAAEIDPLPSQGAGVAFKRHLTGVLSRRALLACAAGAP